MLQHTTLTGRQYRSPTSIMYTQGSILLSIIAFTLQPQIFVIVLFKQLSNRSFFQPGSTMSVIKQPVHVFENKVHVFTAVICSIPCVLLFLFFIFIFLCFIMYVLFLSFCAQYNLRWLTGLKVPTNTAFFRVRFFFAFSVILCVCVCLLSLLLSFCVCVCVCVCV